MNPNDPNANPNQNPNDPTSDVPAPGTVEQQPLPQSQAPVPGQQPPAVQPNQAPPMPGTTPTPTPDMNAAANTGGPAQNKRKAGLILLLIVLVALGAVGWLMSRAF